MDSYDSDDCITISIGDATTSEIEVGDSLYGLDLGADLITFNTSSPGVLCPPAWSLGDSVEFTTATPSITIGSYSLDEQKLERIEALLDVLDDDPEFKEKISNQIAFNRLKK